MNDGDEIEELFFRNDQGALKVYVAYDVAAALGDVDSDVHVLLVGSDRDLCRVDVEIDESIIEIERTQRLEIGRELRFGISVRTRDEREEPGRIKLEIIQQIIVVERDVPYDVDLPDLRDDAFRDLESDRDPVTLDRCHRTRDLGAVLSCRKVRPMQLLLHLVENRSVEDAPLGEPDLLKGGHEILGLEIFVASEFDAADGRSFDHRHDERLAIAREPHIAEETGLEQGTDGSGSACSVHGIADLYRQIVEDGAGGDPLQTFQTDILDDKRIGRSGDPHYGPQ